MAGQAVEYHKQMTEIVYINLPGPREPLAGMSGGELLHGFLAELHDAPSAEVKAYIESLSIRWSVRFRQTGK